jgi:hypothetical protein
LIENLDAVTEKYEEDVPLRCVYNRRLPTIVLRDLR